MRRALPLSKRYLIRWLPLAFAITILSGLIYTAVQQVIRSGANEAQLQIVADISTGLSANEDPQTLLPKQPIDPGVSTSPFVMLYDESGKPVNNTVVSGYQTLAPPSGVFEYARTHKQDRITWEPLNGLRIATIIQHYRSGNASGFVLVGRNIREAERNESVTLQLTALAWLVAMMGSLGLLIITEEMTLRR